MAMGPAAERSQPTSSGYHGKPKPLICQRYGEAKTKSLGEEAALRKIPEMCRQVQARNQKPQSPRKKWKKPLPDDFPDSMVTPPTLGVTEIALYPANKTPLNQTSLCFSSLQLKSLRLRLTPSSERTLKRRSKQAQDDSIWQVPRLTLN